MEQPAAQAQELMKKVPFLSSETGMFVFCYFLGILIALVFVIYLIVKANEPAKTSDALKSKYQALNNSITSLNPNDPSCQAMLQNYIVFGAFNCCNSGTIANGNCSSAAVKSILMTGARFLDFQIFSINDQPSVATSTESSFYVKDSLNSVPFVNVMTIITQYAFSPTNAPNPNDPIILHFRFFSNNSQMYENMASIFASNDSFFLGSQYSFDNYGNNLSTIPLLSLANKIVVIVDGSNPSFLDCPSFCEYVNMTSNSMFLRSLQYSEVFNTPDLSELQAYNCTNMSICIPDSNTGDPDNPNGIVCREAGINFIAMQFQKDDSYLQECFQFFDGVGYAFAYVAPCDPSNATIPSPIPQNPVVSFAPKQISTSTYSFSV
jgi:hypothetical protein